jgi:ribonuclease D
MRLPILQYDGSICLVATATESQRALREIQRERVVGFDTEARPAFRRGQAHAPALVQIAGAGCVYLFQLARLGNCQALAELLSNARLIKAGLALDRDLAELQKMFRFHAASMVDLSSVAKHHGLKQTGLRNLAGLFLGGRITKGAQTSNWAAKRLSQKQICYAATDAWVCRELYLRFEGLKWSAAASPRTTLP